MPRTSTALQIEYIVIYRVDIQSKVYRRESKQNKQTNQSVIIEDIERYLRDRDEEEEEEEGEEDMDKEG